MIRKVRHILSGEFLSVAWLRKQSKFFGLVAGLLFVYVLSGYHASIKQQELTQLKTEVQNLRYEYLTISAELAEMSLQSHVAKELTMQGSSLQQNKMPLVTIEQ